MIEKKVIVKLFVGSLNNYNQFTASKEEVKKLVDAWQSPLSPKSPEFISVGSVDKSDLFSCRKADIIAIKVEKDCY